MTLSPEGVEKLEAKAKALGVSKSELVEQMARDQMSSLAEQELLGEQLTT
ncbi:Ribbon-helix-helix protein, CopG [Nostoc flagelliforme CCNUN1]|uniref:Ribbon-helix-helix protein, CopG n=1 Tax=Nostoc flagelliforme CCNUN1 TaxID=2038116 RepID=A0A2K8T0T3_9NOSO|nr:Ribbon-helix-helix protein, CopG [Nostoc flagelliforme CCNUN1]